MTPQAVNQLRALLDIVAESVAVAGAQGAPGGVLYSAFMAHGATLEQFENLMRLAVAAGVVTKRGELYFAKGG